MKGANIEIVDKMKILGTIVKTNLSWDDNCDNLIKKVNALMQLLRGVQSFGATKIEMVHLWAIFCRSVLEQSSVVWNSSLTKKNEREMERVQKIAVRLIMGDQTEYKESLNVLKLTTQKERRNLLTVTFAKKNFGKRKNKKHICKKY